MVIRKSVLAVAALAAASCGPATRTDEPMAATTGVPTAVEVVSVVRETRPAIVEAGGVLHGQESAVVSSRVMATVVRVLVEPGTRVRSGQLLVQLDDAAVAAEARAAAAGREAAERSLERARADARAADAAAVLARTTYERLSALHERRSATTQEFDDATAARAAAEARVAAAEAGVAEATAAVTRAAAGGDGARAVAAWSHVTAPFDGVVTEKMVVAGALVAPGTPLVRVEDTSVLEIEVRLDDSRASFARIGDAVPLFVDADGATAAREARITEMGRAASLDSRAVIVTLQLVDSAGLRPGMFGRAHLAGPPRDVTAVPVSAVVRRGQLTSVFVVDGATVRMRLVRLGSTFGDEVEIAAGLDAGERVVRTPPASLRDGSPVTVSIVGREAGVTTAGARS